MSSLSPEMTATSLITKADIPTDSCEIDIPIHLKDFKHIASGAYAKVLKISNKEVAKISWINENENDPTVTFREICFMKLLSLGDGKQPINIDRKTQPSINDLHNLHNLHNFHNSNLVRLTRPIEISGDKCIMYMENAGINLEQWVIKTVGSEVIKIIPLIIKECSKVLKIFKEYNIVHGDLSPRNIMIKEILYKDFYSKKWNKMIEQKISPSKRGLEIMKLWQKKEYTDEFYEIKICDFGSIIFEPGKHFEIDRCVSVFCPPECSPINISKTFSPSMDIFSLGMVACYLISGSMIDSEDIYNSYMYDLPLFLRYMMKVEKKFVESSETKSDLKTNLDMFNLIKDMTNLEKDRRIYPDGILTFFSRIEGSGEIKYNTKSVLPFKFPFKLINCRLDSSQNSIVVQDDITISMRHILISWMRDVCEEMINRQYQFSVKNKSIYINSVYILDQYISKNKIDRKNLQELGASCIFLAASIIIDTDEIVIFGLEYLSEKEATKVGIFETCKKILCGVGSVDYLWMDSKHLDSLTLDEIFERLDRYEYV